MNSEELLKSLDETQGKLHEDGRIAPIKAAGIPVTMQAEGYERLADVLGRAFSQSAFGKGKERHANDKAFHDQPILRIAEMTGPAGTAFQSIKKQQEALGMLNRGEYDAAVAEFLGAIVYAAASIVAIETFIAPNQSR